MKFIPILFFCCTIGSGFVVAQKDKGDEGPTEVHVNLSVVDAAQNPVNDLTSADIKLYDEDKEQKITNFSKTPLTNIAFVMDCTGSMRMQLNVEIALAKSIAANLRTGECYRLCST